MNELKKRAIEVAARAQFEAMKQSIGEMADLEWDRLPDWDGVLPSPRCKGYFRGEVATGVEALARQHFLVDPESASSKLEASRTGGSDG